MARSPTQPLGHAAMLAFVLGACAGAAPAERPVGGEGVLLRRHHEEGRRYEVLLVLDSTVPAEEGRVLRVESHGEATLVRVTGDQADVRTTIASTELNVPNGPIALPPLHTDFGGVEILSTIDDRGRTVAMPTTEGDDAQREQLNGALGFFAWGSPSFPEHRVSVGDTWEAPIDWLWVSREQRILGERVMNHELEAVEAGVATISISGRSRMRLATDDDPIEAEIEIEGSVELALVDGIAGTGRAVVDLTWDVPDRAGRFLPSRMGWQWCVRATGSGTSCDVRPPAFGDPTPENRPVAATYEGEACEARLGQMQRRLDAVPDNPAFAEVSELPILATGNDAPIVGGVISWDGTVRLDGREVATPDDLVRDLETLERAWAILHVGQTGPVPILLQVERRTPVAGLMPWLRAAARVGELHLVGQPPPGPPQAELPRPDWVRARLRALDSLDPSQRAGTLAAAISDATGVCTPMIRLFGRIAGTDVTERGARLREGLAPAISECRCGGVALDGLEAFVLATLDVGPPMRWVPMPFARNGRPLRFAADADGQDFVDAVAATRRPWRLDPAR